jgi:hypothetical protein
MYNPSISFGARENGGIRGEGNQPHRIMHCSPTAHLPILRRHKQLVDKEEYCKCSGCDNGHAVNVGNFRLARLRSLTTSGRGLAKATQPCENLA